MAKYKKGHVGITRHPEIYANDNYIPVFADVETELRMWKAAEKVHKIIKRGNFDRRQMAFIMHYVMCLDGMTDDEMYQLHSWQCFKISQSQATQIVLKQIGKSAEQLALAKLERIVEKIADDKEIAIELKEEKKEK